MKTKSVIPKLAVSPFAAAEVIDDQSLSAEDQSFLAKREKMIEAGRKTFLEVGSALLEIRDYRGGLLYKRFAPLMPTARNDGISAIHTPIV